MWDRLRIRGECLLTGTVLSILFLGMFCSGRASAGLQREFAGIENASYAGSALARGFSASVIAGRHRRAGLMTAGWSVCWSGSNDAEKKCFDLTIGWRAQMHGQE
jgi:hypothetical protein